MRAALMRSLLWLAEQDERVVFLTGDLGFSVVEPFAERFPERFFNVGVAEQNMVGIATGMAEAGFIPYVYSIVTFASLRPYEFIRNGPVLHRLPVRIIGVGGGFEYGHAGPTHHGVEDVAVMRTQPGLHVVVPADVDQAVTALRMTGKLSGPIYFRLSKDDRCHIPELQGRFTLGRAEQIREGDDLAFVTMGPVTREAMAAAQDLAQLGIESSVFVVASVTPPPSGHLAQALSGFDTVITVEAHSIVGGLGSLVSEVVAENGLGCRVIRRGVSAQPSLGGSETYLLERHGLSRTALTRCASQALLGVRV
jgi:transketolase